MFKLSVAFLAASAVFGATPKHHPAPEPEPVAAPTKIVEASDDLITLNTYSNHEITIRVPEGEVVSAVELGDPQWKRSHFEKGPVDFVAVRCAFANHPTTMHIVTKGRDQKTHLRPFFLTMDRRQPADVTVILKAPNELETQSNPELLKAQADADRARQEADAAVVAKQKADAAVQALTEQFYKWKRDYPTKLTVNYTINGNKKAAKDPWYILGMFAIDNQTIVLHKDDTGDLPMLFAYDSNGKPLRVHGKYEPEKSPDGILIERFNRKLTRGYFTFGRHKLSFAEVRK